MNTSIINKRHVFIALGIVFILSIPFMAMQITKEVNWSTADFILMALILSGIAAVYELAAHKSQLSSYRIAIGIALLGMFLLFWVNAAVGIIGHESQDANMLYAVVFLVIVIGAAASKMNALAMYKTMMLGALSTIAVPCIAYIIWPPASISWSPGVFKVFLMSGFFASLFVLSAFLFKMSGKSALKM